MYDSSGKPNKFICLAKDFKPKSNKCFDRLMTQEGSKVWEETIKELTTKTYNLGELQWSEGLAQACFDHILDQGPKGAEGHKGSDGSSPFARINRYTTNFGSGENLAYLDFDDAEDAVLDLLIDDGVPDRGHRKNILDSHFTHGGVSCGCHKGFTEMWCFAYGIAVTLTLYINN